MDASHFPVTMVDQPKEGSMTLQMLAIDLGKQSFHLHGIDAAGVIVSRKVSRAKLVVWFIRAIPKSLEAVQALVMRAGIVVNVTPDDRRQLEAIVGDRNAPQKHVWRAKIILATAEGCGTAEIMRRSGKAKPVVWRWQERFMTEGVGGLTRDKTRKPGKPRCRQPRCSG
jgi:hypothetical protein